MSNSSHSISVKLVPKSIVPLGMRRKQEAKYIISYEEQNLRLQFILLPRSVDASSLGNDGVWVLAAPMNLRSKLGVRWRVRDSIYSSIKEYLGSIDFDDVEGFGVVNINEIEIEETEVESYLDVKRKQAKDLIFPITVCLPAKHSLMLIIIGFLIYYTRIEYADLYPETMPFSIMFLVLGILVIALQVQEVKKDWLVTRMFTLKNVLTDPAYNWRKATAKTLMRVYGKRYILTFGMGVCFIYLSMQNP